MKNLLPVDCKNLLEEKNLIFFSWNFAVATSLIESIFCVLLATKGQMSHKPP